MVENNLLKKHLMFELTESGFREISSMLLETYGAVTNIRYYLDAIEKKFLENEDTVTRFDETDFPLGNIKNINIDIVFSENHNKRPDVNGYYACEGRKLNIHLQAASYDRKSVVRKVRNVIGHEMIHAMHEAGLKDTFDNEEISLNDVEPFYNGALYFINNGDKLEKDFGYILYYLSDSEKNAYIGQVFSELEEHADTIIDGNSAKKAILSTDTYKRLEKLHERIQNIKTLSETDKAYLSQAFNRFTGKNYTFKRMLDWMEFRYEKFLSKFFEQASKMANFFYEENIKKNSRVEPKE